MNPSTPGLVKYNAYVMKKGIERWTKLVMWSIVLIIGLGFALPAPGHAESALDFMGPLPGYTYHYEGSGGLKLSLRGITWDQEGALILEETYFFPDSCSPGDGIQRELTRIYGLMPDGNRLVRKEFPLNGHIIYHTELDLDETFWADSDVCKDVTCDELLPVKCRITIQYKQPYAGEERHIIEVSGENCHPRKYASGIGLIEYNNDLRLVRIDGKGTYQTIHE